MYIKIGAVSFNTKNKKINIDRRTIRGQAFWKHALFVVTGAAATAGLAVAVNHLQNR